MILVQQSRRAAFSASGAWGRVTLDGLVRKNAHSRPDALALADAPDRSDWTGGTPRRLTYAELNAEMEATASLFSVIGLDVGSVVGLQAANTVDTIVAFLGALRAGLIVTPLPTTWRESEIQTALEILAAKAAIAADRIETLTPADHCRNAARKLFGIRYILGLGADLPDGVLSLGHLRTEAGEVPPCSVHMTADDVATATWAAPLGGDPVPLPRSHNQWIAAGLMQMIEARLEPGSVILSPFAPSGLIGLGAVVAPWLLSGAELHLHHFRSIERITDHAKAIGADHVPLPASLTDAFARALERKDAGPARITAVWSNGHPTSGDGNARAGNATQATIDITNFGEYAYYAARRDSVEPAPIPLGSISAPSAGKAAPTLLDIRLGPKSFSVSGPMVPDIGWPGNLASPIALDEGGLVPTGLPGETLAGDPSLARPLPYSGAFWHAGGAVIDPEMLDRLYSECPEVDEAAAFLIEDPVLGARIGAALVQQAGESATPDALYAFLDEMRISLDKRPANVFIVPEIPREVDGRIDRAELSVSLLR